MKFILYFVFLIPFCAYSQTFDELLAAGDYAKAETLLKAQDSGRWKSQKNKALFLTNTGALHLNKGRQDIALEKLQEAYAIFQQSNTDHSKDAAKCLSLLSLTYNASGKYNQAETNGLMALQLRQELSGEQSEEVAASYNDLGLVYSQIDPDKALEYYEKALVVYKKLHGNEHPKIAIANTNIGGLYTQIELYGDAINNLEAASKIWLNLYPNGHPNLGFVYRNLGQTYMKMENSKLALTYFEKALEQYRKSFGEKHPDIASTLNQIGAVHLNQQLFDEALHDFQQAMCANIPAFNQKNIDVNPSVSEFYNANVLLYSLMLKAQGLEAKHFGKTLDLSDLKLALACLYLCDSLIDDIRHHSADESDKISLGALANDVYEDGVRLASAISDITAAPRRYHEIAFYFAEKSKSAVLQESIADAQAKSFAGIPQDLVDEEKNLKSGIAFLAQKLSLGPPAEEEKYLRESLFVLNNEYSTFTKKLEKDFPNYYNLKFNNAFPTVEELKAMLGPDEAIVSYFVAEKSGKMFQFVITHKNFKSFEKSMPADFDRLTKGLINGIYYRDYATYAKSASELKYVLWPETGKENVIVIPSGRMSTLPLEALAKESNSQGFANTSYLAQTKAISYEFSAALFAQKRKQRSANGSTAQSIFLCAPVRFPQKDHLNELPASESEINTIASLFPEASREIMLFDKANEATVKSNSIANYNYLHFATHGVVDETDPELSKIFLSESTGDDGHLYSGEIYNLNLNADLAVLSACQTGLGKYSKGEGVIGLSRALVYAGAKNLIVSFWSVADESTAQLMTDFYSELLKNPGRGFSYSLQRSKVKMIGSKKFSEPYYWAPFVLIGF
ncbi:MAG TPA: CHAT domain-containing tetratricopeptide repeat protein [Cyclobacteriaceae bacterium]|nr:CHAT domain-containing tetratricopeptide repeat protein [Cyclobacteriaceae bacterium]